MYNRFQTDALNPSSLPTASLGRPRPLSRFNPPSTDPNLDNLAIGQRQQAVLDRVHEEWNGRIDREVKAVAGSLKDLVNLADIGSSPTPHAYTTQSLHLKLHTSQLIRATQNLRDIAHELRLTLVLSDEVETAQRRDREMKRVRKQVEGLRGKVGRQVVDLMGGSAGGAGRFAEDGKLTDKEVKDGVGEVNDGQTQDDAMVISTPAAQTTITPDVNRTEDEDGDGRNSDEDMEQVA